MNRFCMFDVMPWMGLEVTSFPLFMIDDGIG